LSFWLVIAAFLTALVVTLFDIAAWQDAYLLAGYVLTAEVAGIFAVAWETCK
jgi:hypothetical protein